MKKVFSPVQEKQVTRAIAKRYFEDFDRLVESDLADPQLLLECRAALDELTQILKLGSVYPFQLQP